MTFLGLSYLLSIPPTVYQMFLPSIPHIYRPIKNENTQQVKQGSPKKYEHLFITRVEKFIPPCFPLILHQYTKKISKNNNRELSELGREK
jgi:hypothetical protein